MQRKFSVNKVTQRKKTGMVEGLLKRSNRKAPVNLGKGVRKATRKVGKKRDKN